MASLLSFFQDATKKANQKRNIRPVNKTPYVPRQALAQPQAYGAFQRPARQVIPMQSPPVIPPKPTVIPIARTTQPVKIGSLNIKQSPMITHPAPVGPDPVANFLRNNVIQPIARSAPEVAVSARELVTGNRSPYNPGSSIEKTIFGKQPVKPIQEDVRGTYRAVKAGHQNLPGGIPISPNLAIPYAVADAVLHIGQDAPLVGAAAKGFVKAGQLTEPIIKSGIENRTLLNEVGAVGKNVNKVKPKVTAGATPRFTGRVKQLESTPKEVSKAMSGHYNILPNKVTMQRATQEINANPEAAVSRILGPNYKPTTHNHAVAMLLAEKARKAGNYDQMTSILERVGNEASNPGQAIQVLSQWGKSTPNGIIRYAQKVVREGHRLPDGTPTKTLTTDQAKEFGSRMEAIQRLPEGRNKQLATAKLLQDIHNLVPSSSGSKLRNMLYYAQLLNPKTAIRNVGGNIIFGTFENVSDTVGAPLDKAISGVRRAFGQNAPRTVYVPNIPGQLKIGAKGAKEAYQEAKLGVNLSGTTGQYEAYGRPPAFNNIVGRKLDQALAVELSTPDRFALSGAQYQALRNQLRASGIDKKLLTPDRIWAAKLGQDAKIPITQDMLERAGELGKYRTFQDNSVPARFLSGLKSTLNLKKDFGVGNFVMNYPKTPGNLLARGLDFSPAGFIKTTIEMGKPLFGKGFNQEQFVRSFSRALVGSGGLVGTGAALNKLGIITGRPDPSKSANAADKALGLGQYKINVSALKRFIASGLDPNAAKIRKGDTLVSYDWAQPASFALTMGANLNQTQGSPKGAVKKVGDSLGKGAGEVVDAMNSLAEQPVLQGLQTLTGSSGGGLTSGIIQTATSAPSGFVPTILNQINQLIDNKARSTYDPNPLASGVKKVEAKIPGVASTLQPQVNILGKPTERYQGGTNNPFNVFLNPAFVSKYAPNNVLNEVKRLQNTTSETSQIPKQVAYTQKVNGKNVQLSPQQVTDLQTFVGQKAGEQLSKIISSPDYKKASDGDKVTMLTSALTAISQAGRAVVLNDNKKLSKNALAAAQGFDVNVKPKSTKSTTSKIPKSTNTVFDPATNTYTQTSSTGKVTKIAADGTRTVVSKGLGKISGANPDWSTQIRSYSVKHGVDPNAALAVAAMEGLGGGVGDNGTSYGPFQLHVGGALPKGKDRAWAESPAGIEYAIQQMSKVAKGKKGQDAINAIVSQFERPADPNSEIAGALAIYGGKSARLSPGSAKSTYIASGTSRKSSTKTKQPKLITTGFKTAKSSSVKTPKGVRVKTPKYPKLATVKTSKIPQISATLVKRKQT